MDLVADSAVKLLGRLHPIEYLPVYPHSSAPCHTLQRNVCNSDATTGIDVFSQLFEELSYDVTYPVPVNKPTKINKQVINGKDPELQIVKEKQEWEKMKTELLKYCSKQRIGNVKDSDLESADSLSLPYSAVLLGDHFSKDPDKYLNNNYNVYYTGGNISNIVISSDEYLIFPKTYGGESCICLERVPGSSTSSFLTADTTVHSSTARGDTIFQIETFKNCIVSRQKKRINLFSVGENESGTYYITNLFDYGNDIPYFSVALHEKKLCTTSAERKLDVFDITKAKTTLSGIIDSEEGIYKTDSWSMSHFVDANTICFIDRTCIGFVDLRTKTTFAKKWPISPVSEHCEEVYSGAMGSKGIEYVVTSHHLLTLDPRVGFLQKWNHGITHSPAYLSIAPNSSWVDRIFIGSQMSDSVVFVENNVLEESFIGRSHPYLLPNLLDTYHLARYNGYCLGNYVPTRFFMCLTGFCVLEKDKQINLFRLTSSGDIFKQALSKSCKKSEVQLTDSELERLYQWENDCEVLFAEDNRTCTVAAIVSDAHIKDYIKYSKDYVEPNEKLDFSKVPWKISKEELLNCCDYLAPRILEEWGLEDMKEWASDALQQAPSPELSFSSDEDDITQKVTDWLEKHSTGDKEVDIDEEDVYYEFQDDSSDEVILAEPEEHFVASSSISLKLEQLLLPPSSGKQTAGF